jgi:hypothetical protein
MNTQKGVKLLGHAELLSVISGDIVRPVVIQHNVRKSCPSAAYNYLVILSNGVH